MAIKVILAIVFALMAIGFVAGAIVKFSTLSSSSSSSSYSSWSSRTEETPKKKKSKAVPITLLCIGLISLVLFILVPWNFRQVDAGEIAVVKQYGKVIDTREPGVHSDFYMTKSYTILDTKVRQVDITAATYSNDKQTMDITMTIQYQIKKDMAKEIVIQYGNLDTLEGRIQSVSIERAKAILSAYTADSIIEQRSTISVSVAEAIETALGDAYYIDITNVALTNIDFSDAYEQAVEQKMIATQEVEKAKADAQKAEETAKGQLKVAEQEAEAKKVQAQAEADAVRIKAEADAEAIQIKSLEVAKMLGLTEIDSEGNERIKEGITKEESALISEYLKYIEYLTAWDGKLPEVMTGDSTGIILGGNN